MYIDVIFVITIFIYIYTIINKNRKIEGFDSDLPNNIWMYWQNKPNSKKPIYLDLCYKTIIKNCNNFKVRLLDENSVYKYLPNLRRDLDENMSIPQKTDYIRINLLYNYGGIWIDSDTIVVKDLFPLLKYLDRYEYIGFGCTGLYCNKLPTGKPKPSNWVMISRKHGKLMNNCIKEADKILNNKKYLLKIDYHILGRVLLWKNIKYLIDNEKWDYLHISSKCTERDSSGIKYKNKRLLTNEEYDSDCRNKIYFLPIYNTAPGFPPWFKKLSENEILSSNMLISKMFNIALK